MGYPASKNKPIKISTAYTVILSALFIIVALVVILFANYAMKREALKDAALKSRIILDRNLATHTYFTHQLKPNVFAVTDKHLPAGYFEPSWMSSTYAVREIDKYARQLNESEYYYKECAINARSPENEADPYERQFINELNADPNLLERTVKRTIDGKPYFVVMRRGEVMEERCLRCHSTPDLAPAGLIEVYGAERSFNRKVDDVVSAISIRIPLGAAYAKANLFSIYLSGLFLFLLGFVYWVQILINKKLLFSPINRVREKAMQITTDENYLGQEIDMPFGRELSELTAEFNKMSVSLRHNRDNLEYLVEKRTEELREALSRVKTLSGLLPICASCKKIRDDKGYWNQIEAYISKHSTAEFSHGICPECAKKIYPEFYKGE